MRWTKLGIQVALCLGLLLAIRVEAVEDGPLEGERAVKFALKTLEGKPYGLADALAARHPVLLSFCATWCKDCKAVLPRVKEINQKYAGRVTVLAVNTAFNDSLKNAIEYKKKNNLTYTVVYDEKGEVADNYMVFGTPLFVLIDPQGIVKYRGSKLPGDLEKFLK